MPHTSQQTAQQIDTLIIGQGLAGSLLAWQLMQQGQSIGIVCDDNAASASRVAAGIFNPVSGQRLVLQAQAEHIIASARQCYAQLESQFGQTFFHAMPMLRVFKHDNERQRFEQRRRDTDYAPYLGRYINKLDPIHAPHGLCQQHQTGYLDINALLDCWRDYFIAQHCYMPQRFEYADLKVQTTGITWHHIHAKRIIFCQGFMDQDNPWFSHLPFQPAKGEILTLKIDANLSDHIINGGKWLLPLGNRHYKTGATYAHDLSDTEPSAQAKAELLKGLQHLISTPLDVEVVKQQAGIRPNTLDKHPFIGFHAEQSAVGIFNGFGSKGSMLIPYYAQAFAHHIGTASSIPGEADIARIASCETPRLAKRSTISLTERVHQSLIAHINPSHIVIDATAGNGHDTLFLAKHIDASGQVFAFDIQMQAIDNTYKKLKQAGLNDRVTLLCCGHENMLEHIPDECIGKVQLIMFNLGYLPRADKAIITQSNTTLTALDAAIQLIAPDGRISILAYPGHPGGTEESNAVKAWLMQLSKQAFTVITHEPLHAASISPVWIEVIHQRCVHPSQLSNMKNI